VQVKGNGKKNYPLILVSEVLPWKIPQVITLLEQGMNSAQHTFDNRLAYHEGRRAYFQGIPRDKNVYEIVDEDRAAAWWRGWDDAEEEDRADGYKTTPPSKDEP
jgi:hypothetical protein